MLYSITVVSYITCRDDNSEDIFVHQVHVRYGTVTAYMKGKRYARFSHGRLVVYTLVTSMRPASYTECAWKIDMCIAN